VVVGGLTHPGRGAVMSVTLLVTPTLVLLGALARL
jgi:hypothetical protein